MDSNFKLNQLYVFSDLTIGKIVNEHKIYPTFKEIRSGDKFGCDINSKTLICTELFFKIEDIQQKKIPLTNYYAYQFLTDLFQLTFHKYSILIQTRVKGDAILLSNGNHIDCVLKYEDKFILKVHGKKVEDILISNFDRKVAQPILEKHNRLFECL